MIILSPRQIRKNLINDKYYYFLIYKSVYFIFLYEYLNNFVKIYIAIRNSHDTIKKKNTEGGVYGNNLGNSTWSDNPFSRLCFLQL